MTGNRVVRAGGREEVEGRVEGRVGGGRGGGQRTCS